MSTYHVPRTSFSHLSHKILCGSVFAHGKDEMHAGQLTHLESQRESGGLRTLNSVSLTPDVPVPLVLMFKGVLLGLLAEEITDGYESAAPVS